jgi:hypothetical protein
MSVCLAKYIWLCIVESIFLLVIFGRLIAFWPFSLAMQLAKNGELPTIHFLIQMLEISIEIWFVIDGSYDMNIYCNDDVHLGVVCWG